MPSISEPARPKVNLTLKVLGRRPDGYHEIESLVVFALGLADRVGLDPGQPEEVRVTGPFAHAIGRENLLERALAEAASADPELRLGAVLLEKNIPVAAGLGGGSADAAALLRAIRRANPGRGEAVDWARIAARLGADVPVCLADRAALVTGVGERVSLLPQVPELPAVLVHPMISAPPGKTAQVFHRLAAAPAPTGEHARRAFLSEGCPATHSAFIDALRAEPNDLTDAARGLMPEIGLVLSALEAAPGCLMARMSGAGPACFGLFGSEETAHAAALELGGRQPDWWVKPVLLG